MNLLHKYFFGYLPSRIKNILRGICLVVLVILIMEMAITFVFFVIIIGLISKIMMRFFY